MRKTLSKIALSTFAACLITGAASAQEIAGQDVKFSGALSYGFSSGDYGTTQTTDIQMTLATLAVEVENFKFSASIPYMHIDGRGLVLFDAVGSPIVVNRFAVIPPDRRTGWGDLYLGASYSIPPAVLDDFEVRLTARIKVPTAPARRRLGTGQEDYGFSVDVSRAFGIWKPFLTIGYLVPGQPVGFVLNDTTSVSAGTSLELSDDLVAIVAYDYASASSPRVDNSEDLFGSLSWLATDNFTLTGYGTAGLSSGSPDAGAGLILSYGFN